MRDSTYCKICTRARKWWSQDQVERSNGCVRAFGPFSSVLIASSGLIGTNELTLRRAASSSKTSLQASSTLAHACGVSGLPLVVEAVMLITTTVPCGKMPSRFAFDMSCGGVGWHRIASRIRERQSAALTSHGHTPTQPGEKRHAPLRSLAPEPRAQTPKG